MLFKQTERIALATINTNSTINESKRVETDMHDDNELIVSPTASAYIDEHGFFYSDHDFTGDIERIGSGFFAEVYRVVHGKTKVTMAFKVPKSTESMSRFMKEVRLLKSLCHDNVLRFHGSCLFGGVFGCLTEYLDSGSLSSLIEKQGSTLDWSTGVHVAGGVAQGLQYLHRKSLIHRDLSSENVLLHRTDSKDSSNNISTVQYRAVIADLGLVLNLNERRSDQMSTVGNPFYTAPENLKNQSPYNYASDIFSFGMILCEIITGLKNDPNNIHRTNNYGVDYKKLNVRKDCPKWLHSLACDCCMVYVNKRPTAKEILDNISENKKYIGLWQSAQIEEPSGSLYSKSLDQTKLRSLSFSVHGPATKQILNERKHILTRSGDTTSVNGTVSKLVQRPALGRYNSVDSFIDPGIMNLYKAHIDPGYVDEPLSGSLKRLDPRRRIQGHVGRIHVSRKLSRCSSESDLSHLITSKKLSPNINTRFFFRDDETVCHSSALVSSSSTKRNPRDL